MSDFFHSFNAVRGIQASKPCFIAMCPLRIIPKIFVFDEDEVPPEMRAQRKLNKSRLPEIANYLIETFDSANVVVSQRCNNHPMQLTR